VVVFVPVSHRTHATVTVVRRLLPFALLAVIALYLGSQGVDLCGTGGADCPPDCHLSCGDGCAVAPVPPPDPALAPHLPLRAEPVHAGIPAPLDRPTPPEIGPPRA
jgi:hypothetical protein